MRTLVSLCIALALGSIAVAAPTTIKWHGHATFEIVTPKGAVFVIDPWIANPQNPAAKDGKDPLASFAKVDYILITHGHFDHVGQAVELGKKTGAKLVSNFELGKQLVTRLGYPEKQVGFDTQMNIGGEIPTADGEVTVAMVPAVHASGVDVPGDSGRKADTVYGGNPGGFVLVIKDGPTIYTTGDTAYFGDMAMIGEQYHPDLALINIGGHFGMEPPMAARAAAAVKAKLVVPMHWKTFPILTQDEGPFLKALDQARIKHHVMKGGETLVFEGKTPKL
jgi:L-ascorbate metabolism protein UlaG (beta-lactamase superfamily)